MPKRGRSLTMEQKIDAAMRRQYIAQGRMGMTPYARPQLSALGGLGSVGMGMFGTPFSMMGARAQRRTTPQLSMTGMTLPNYKWEQYAQIVIKWPDVENFPKINIWDTTIVGTDPLLSQKDKILMFNDDIQTDYWSSMLSPMFGGPIQINVPVPATYKTPIHYVEGMKVISSSSPGMLFGGVAQAVFSGGMKMEPCDVAKSQIDYTLANPYAQMVMGSTTVCDDKAKTNGFYKVQSEPCKFWTSLWLALYSKHMNRGAVSSRGSYQSALLSTGKKLLIYQGSGVYGVKDDKSKLEGINGVGIILMILRAIAQKGMLVEDNAGPAWEKVAKPILTAILGDDGMSVRP